MKNSRVMSTALVTFAALASPAAAEGLFSGGEVSLNYGYNQTEDFDFRALGGSVVGQFGGVVSQLDLFSGSFDETTSYNAFTVHLGYELASGATVGVFYGMETWQNGFEPPYYGVEFAYESGQFALDAAYISVRDPSDTGDEFHNALQLDGTYHLNERFDLIALLAKTDNGSSRSSFNGTTLGVGGRYNMASGAFVELSAQNFDRSSDRFPDQMMVEFRFGYEFGNGKAFGGRTYGDYFPAY